MDADLSHDAKELPKFNELLNEHEFIIGSRYMKGGIVKCLFLGSC